VVIVLLIPKAVQISTVIYWGRSLLTGGGPCLLLLCKQSP